MQRKERQRPDVPSPAKAPLDIVTRLREKPVHSSGFSVAVYMFTHTDDRDIIALGARVLAERFAKSVERLGELVAQVEPCWVIEVFRSQLLFELAHGNKTRHSLLVGYGLGHLYGCADCRRFLLGDRPQTDRIRLMFPKEYFAKPAKPVRLVRHRLAAAG
jgi:hypothetical protein